MAIKLSAYTMAKNCTDLSDVAVGMEELSKYINSTTKPCKSAYIRYHKLNEKRLKLKK